MAEEIIKITDHADAAVARLPGQYKGKPRIEALVRSIGKQTQDLEDAAFTVLLGRSVDTAVGPTLDDVGAIVGQPRQGFDDDFYRILIYVKIAENFSNGAYRSVVAAFRLITKSTVVHYLNLGHAAVGLYGDGAMPPVDAKFIYSQLQRITSDGVKVAFITLSPPNMGGSAKAFAYAGGPVPRPGYRSIYTGEIEGGKYVSLVKNS